MLLLKCNGAHLLTGMLIGTPVTNLWFSSRHHQELTQD